MSRGLIGWYALLAGAFLLTYGQAPVYYSNQNQYFLHGVAQAGVGELAADWLAQTRDPTPLFSAIVASARAWLGEWPFYLIYALILSTYFLTLHELARWRCGERWTMQYSLGFTALIFLSHAAILRWLSYRLLGGDYLWYAQSGVAGQYILGGYWQPSTFGVLLVMAIVLFIRERWGWASLAIAGAVSLHSTYLLPAAFITLGCQLGLIIERRYREAVRFGMLTLLLVLPTIAYVLRTFWPSDATTFAEAQRLLVHVRIPHHCLPGLWCDPIAVVQIVSILIGIVLSWRTRLFPILLSTFLLGVVGTLLQVGMASDGLALMFPWRISAILVPISTALIVLGVAQRWPRALSISIIAVLSVAGTVMLVLRLGFQVNEEERPLLDWVQQHAEPGQVYLIPTALPNLAKTTRGSLSSDYKPLASKRTDTRIIPVDLQRFRLTTGVPIYVDFKSVPYADVEVLEWYTRIRQAMVWYERINQGEWDQLHSEWREQGITHIVLPTDRPAPVSAPVYADALYRVYALSD